VREATVYANIQEWKAAEVKVQAGAATQNQERRALEVKLASFSSHWYELKQANKECAARGLEWHANKEHLEARLADGQLEAQGWIARLETAQHSLINVQNSAAVEEGAATSWCRKLEREAMSAETNSRALEVKLGTVSSHCNEQKV
jgi:hypothetical protein